jgi:CubicO group peptidase (beta-lactamase class C family)
VSPETPPPSSAVRMLAAGFPPLDPTETKKYHDLVNNYLQSTLLRTNFNGSILVAKNGTIVYEKYIGFSDPRVKDSITAETSTQIASTSKTFTSAAILRLVSEGKLQLDDSVAKFFPGFSYPDVTVKTLLNHRSGLPEYLYFFEKQKWNRNTLITNNDVVNNLITQKPTRAFRPDARFDYCNTNFVLLASIVEKVTGQTFPNYMKTTFFEPLQMNHTFVYSPTTDSSQVTKSYNWDGRAWPMDFSDGPYGDKNIYSTPRDLLKWDQALYNGQVLEQKLLDTAFTAYSNERKTQHNYGLGWRLLEFNNDKRVIYHNGRWHGFNSAFARLTDEKVTIIILGNKYNRNVYTTARKLYNLFGNYGGTDHVE